MAGTERSMMRPATFVLAIVVAACAGGLLVGFHEQRVARRERAPLEEKSKKFDSFCDQQRVFLGVIRDQLQSGSASWKDASMTEFNDVFVSQYGVRDLIACLGSVAWDHERAEQCSASKDRKCMVEIATKTMDLLSGSAVTSR